MAWWLSGAALVWLGVTRAWYGLLWWLFSTPVRNWNGHVHRMDPPPYPLTWPGCVALGALTTLWLIYRLRGDKTPLLILGTLCLLGIEILVPNFIRCRCQGPNAACKSNLKAIGIAIEMYSSDHAGAYPRSLSTLTPDYLRTLPNCPYGRSYSTALAPQAYTVVCGDPDHYHRRGYPQYTSATGLVEP